MNTFDVKFNDLRGFRLLVPELTDSQIKTLLVCSFSGSDTFAAEYLGVGINALQKQKKRISARLGTESFTGAKALFQFRVSVNLYIKFVS